MARGHRLRLPEVCASRNAGDLFAVGSVVMTREIECYETDARAAVPRLYADYVLMLWRARAELGVIVPI